jgi:hypothetical protein
VLQRKTKIKKKVTMLIVLSLVFLFGDLKGPAYQVLKTTLSEDIGAPGKSAHCIISIQNSLNVEEFQKLVCDAIHQEKLDNHEKIMIFVYLKLTSIPVETPIDPEVNKYKKYFYGAYIWHSKFSPKGKLRIAMDSKGNLLKKGWIDLEFRHDKACGCGTGK